VLGWFVCHPGGISLKRTVWATRALTGALLLTASCAADLGPAEAPTVPWEKIAAECPPSPSALACGQRMVEQPFFRDFGRYARRLDAKTVVLTLRDGSEVSIGSENDCLVEDEHQTADCATKTPLLYFARRGFFLFQVTYYEDGDFLLVSDRDGRETSLPAPPHFSPDGASFVAATGPGVPNYSSNAVEIWAVRGGTPARVFSLIPDDRDWGYEFVTWQGPDRVALTYRFWQEGDAPRAAHAIRQGSRWSIVTDPIKSTRP
jgi:hypothetical protein